jgi:hypothetical protein
MIQGATLTVCYSRAERVLWRQATDRVLLLPATDGELVSLTGTGVALWELLTEPIELSELSAVMGAAYNTDPQVVEADLLPLLEDLARRGLVQVVS